MNFGVSGYYAKQEIELFKTKALEYNPDLVVFALVVNDLQGGTWKLWKKDNSFYHVKQSYLYTPSLIHDVHMHRILEKSKLYELSSILLYRSFSKQLNFKFHYKEENNNLVKDFQVAKNLAEKSDMALRIIIIPNVVDYSDYTYMKIHEKLAETADKANISYIDLYDGLKEYDYRSFKIDDNDDFHYNGYGNGILSELIYTYLKDEKLI